jgi:hypothetical protein
MRRAHIGRQARFFAVLALVSLVLYYPTPPELRGVPLFGAALAGFWAIALSLQDLTTPMLEPPDKVKMTEPEDVLFAPPPRGRP